MSPHHLARDAGVVPALGVLVHPRDPDGRESLDPRTIGAVTSAIRKAAPRTEIGVTTARWVEPDPAPASRSSDSGVGCPRRPAPTSPRSTCTNAGGGGCAPPSM